MTELDAYIDLIDWDADEWPKGVLPVCSECLDGRHWFCYDLVESEEFGLTSCDCQETHYQPLHSV